MPTLQMETEQEIGKPPPHRVGVRLVPSLVPFLHPLLRCPLPVSPPVQMRPRLPLLLGVRVSSLCGR